MSKLISNTIGYVGVNDHDVDLFEGQYKVKNGMSYNSYVLLGNEPAIIDTVEKNFTKEWLESIKTLFKNKEPKYLILNHVEPDHSGSIEPFLEVYPNVTIVCRGQASTFIKQFYKGLKNPTFHVVEEGDSLEIDNHLLHFIAAPMVHWPEVMFTYDETTKTLFSADAFGKFGANDIEEDWLDEARRYYFGIVGRYGSQVQLVLNKAKDLKIERICSTHGPILDKDLGFYLGKYDLWSKYGSEFDGVVIAYCSMYGHTKEAVDHLIEKLHNNGIKDIKVFDLAREDISEALSMAFAYSKLVVASPTYNMHLFPFMDEFLHEIAQRNFQGKFVGFIQNGSWAPNSGDLMKNSLSACKNLTIVKPTVKILSSLSDQNEIELNALAYNLTHAENEFEAQIIDKKVVWVCRVCGYVYENAELPENFACPVCHYGRFYFERVEKDDGKDSK